MSSSRPPSPIKKTFQKLLSPSKSKPLPPSPPQFPLHQQGHSDGNGNNWTYAESTASSGSEYSQSTSGDSGGTTGWSVVETPPSMHHNKENVNLRNNTKSLVDQVMGRTLKKPLNQEGKSDETELDKQFEELMVR
jgi:hypothetical protein